MKELTAEKLLKCRRISVSLIPTDVWVLQQALAQLPDDAVLINVGMDHERHRWQMIVVSDKFGKVTEGMIVPEIVVKIDGRAKKVELVMPMEPANFLSALEEL